jgi:DNA-binding PadR family transcriptional regulator
MYDSGIGPRRRMPRGHLRRAILRILAEEPCHGYEIIQILGERTGGMWQPSPGSVYPTLSLLEDSGLVTASDEGGRKVYTLTPAGRREVADVKGSDEEGLPSQSPLSFAVSTLYDAVRQLTLTGDTNSQEKAAEILSQARKQLYRLLAEQ